MSGDRIIQRQRIREIRERDRADDTKPQSDIRMTRDEQVIVNGETITLTHGEWLLVVEYMARHEVSLEDALTAVRAQS